MARSRSATRKPSPRGAAASAAAPVPPVVDPDEIRRVLGPLDDAQVCRVLECGADQAALQQAAAALAGDLPGHIGRPIDGPAARVYDLLAAETDEESGRPARGVDAEP
jgi:hypothetical protein